MNTCLKYFFSLFLVITSLTHAKFIGLDKVIAIVDDSVITQTDLNAAEDRLIKNMREQNQPIPETHELRKIVMDNLILEKIQMQMAQRAGVYITEEHLTQAMNTIASRKGMTLDQMVADLKSKGESYTQLREQIKKELAIQQVQQSYLRNRININEQAINEYLNSHEGKARIQSKFAISHLLIRLDGNTNAKQEAKAKSTLEKVASDIRNGKRRFEDFDTAQTINGFSVINGDLGVRTKDELPSLFADIVPNMQPGELSSTVRSGAGWHVVKLNDLGGAAKIVHQVNARHILIKLSEVRNNTQAKRLIDDLYKRIKKGEDFSLLAKEYSEDPGSALQGGELGWAEPTKYVGAFKDTLLTLENKAISKPFESEFGWHIVQKLEERDHNLTDELRKNQAFQTLYQRKAAEEIDAWLGQIRDEAFIEFKVPEDLKNSQAKP